MKNNILFTVLLLWLFIFTNASAKVVEYNYTGIDNDQKRIQLVGSLISDKDVKMTEYNHEISFPVNKNNQRNEYEIPKYTPLEQKLIDSLWYEKLNKLIWNGVIHIEGNVYRFLEHYYSPWGGYKKVLKLENKDVLYTNMNHRRTVIIESDKNQEVTFKLYPIPSQYHAAVYWKDDLSYPDYVMPDKNTLLTLYDTTSEYHNISWSISNNPLTLSQTYEKINSWVDLSEINPSSFDIEKKYELFTFKRKFPININWESKAILPYYEFTVDVKKWNNRLYLYYSTYQFDWENIQIR